MTVLVNVIAIFIHSLLQMVLSVRTGVLHIPIILARHATLSQCSFTTLLQHLLLLNGLDTHLELELRLLDYVSLVVQETSLLSHRVKHLHRLQLVLYLAHFLVLLGELLSEYPLSDLLLLLAL